MDDILDEHEVDTQELNECFDYSTISSEENNDVTASAVDCDEEHKQIDPKIDKRIETVSSHASTSTCKTQPLRKLTQRTVKQGLSKNQRKKKRKQLKNKQTEDETNTNGRGTPCVKCQMNRNMLRVDDKDNIKGKRMNRCVTEAIKENNGIRNCQISNGVQNKIEHVVTDVETMIYQSLNWISLQTLQLLRPGVSKKPNYHIISKVPPSLLTEVFDLSDSINTLLTNLPLNTAAIASAIDDYLLFLPSLQVRPLRIFLQIGNCIKNLSKMHEQFVEEPGERSLRRYLNTFHGDRKMFLQLRLPQVVSDLEEGVLGELCHLRVRLSATISVEMDGYMARRRSGLDESAWRCWSLESWECGSLPEQILSEVSGRLRSDDELTEIDECRERRFFYDGSYYEGNCTSWLHFRNLFLNSVVSVAFRGQSSIRPRAQHLVVADLVKDEAQRGDASRSLPESAIRSEDDDSKLHDNASVYDETFNSFEDRLSIKSIYKRDLESSRTADLVQNDEKSDSSFCGNIQIGDLNLHERNSVFENEETKIEDIANTNTADNCLQFVQEFSNVKSVVLRSVFLLVFSKMMWSVLSYHFDIVFLLIVFMCLCIYFVIKS